MNHMAWAVRRHMPAPGSARTPSEVGMETRIGWTIILAFLGGLPWAGSVRLDAAAYASGVVAVAGHRQSVQHRGGGTVSRITVHEGNAVRAGQVLISFAPQEIEATERALAAQVIGLGAEQARLGAEQAERPAIVPPTGFSGLTGEDRIEAEQALDLQRQEMATRREALAARKWVLRQQSAALAEAVSGYDREIATTARQRTLLGAELDGLRGLASRGFASLNRVREMQRVDAGLNGQVASLAASAAQSRAQIGQNDMQTLSLDNDRLEEVARALRDAGYQLADLLPKLQAVREQIARVELRAPVSGRVAGLSVFSPGTIVAPGQRVLDVVPDTQPIVIDARPRPDDTDGVHVGQRVEIKVSAIHDRRLAAIHGRITRLSPDVLTDERTGAQYFALEASVPDAEIRRVVALRGADGALRPGQPAQIIVPLAPRTALQYVLGPILDPFWPVFRERQRSLDSPRYSSC